MAQGKKLARQIGVGLIGFPLVLAGIAMLVLPGPGIVVIIIGLLVLAREFEWAQHHADTLKRKSSELAQKAKQKATRRSQK